MEEVVISTEETKILAGELAQRLEPGMVLGLSGDLGTGKTTFTRFLVDQLGINAKVQSPSFVLARIYERQKTERTAPSPTPKKGVTEPTQSISPIERVNHLDLYRLRTKEDLETLGLEDFLNQKDAITIIEWPEIAQEFLPQETLYIKFEDLGENKRKIYFK